MPLITAKNTLYNPPIVNFSVITNTSTDFSLYIETNKQLLNNQSFQKQPDGYKFTGTDSNEFIFYICDSENPKYKFDKDNKFTDWQITLIVLSSIIAICGISICIYFICKKK